MSKKIIKLTENDLNRIIKRVIEKNNINEAVEYWHNIYEILKSLSPEASPETVRRLSILLADRIKNKEDLKSVITYLKSLKYSFKKSDKDEI